ncbi:MAG: hypothetical protein R3A52_05140 [Polyangiales bacterium]
MTRRLSTLGLAYAAFLTSGCPGGFGAGTLGGSCNGDLGASASAQKVETFIATANAFAANAAQLNATLLNACRTMGRDLGIPAAELGAGDSPEALRAACERVSNQLRADLTEIRGSAGVTVELQTVPPRCEVSVDAYGRCAAECDASFTPGQAQVQCEGGELRGACEAQCTGRCAVEVSGSCDGACEGTCQGTAGADGSCQGTCQGRCVSRASGQCGGECRGECSVAFREPRCTGRVEPPRVSADCRAACDARLDAQATCTPGRAELRINGNVGTNLQQKVERVQAAIRSGFSQVLQVRAQVERSSRSGAALARAIADLPSAARSIGIQAATCAGAAVGAVTSSVASVNVSVQVSVQVSGSVSAN